MRTSDVVSSEVERSLDVIIKEFNDLQDEVYSQKKEIESLEETISDLEKANTQLQTKIEELEVALLEAHFTSEANDGECTNTGEPGISREHAELRPGCGTDVPDSAGN